jgi:hypothetical protein
MTKCSRSWWSTKAWIATECGEKLGHLPKGHAIWLLTEDQGTGEIRPQGFYAVQYNEPQKTWSGLITGNGKGQVKIIAVVAPPTSIQFFRYFQSVGRANNYKFTPLNAIPPECKNITAVQALRPKAEK